MDDTEFEVIRSYDPEIRHRVPAEAAGRYAVTRDLAELELPPEAKPVRFRCRALTRSQRDVIRTVSDEATRHILCFRFGVLEIRNLPNGSGLRTWAPSRAKPDAPLDDAALDATGLGDVDLIDIGAAIEGLSFLALGVRPACQQPRSSRRAWGAQVASLSRAEPKSETETGDQ